MVGSQIASHQVQTESRSFWLNNFSSFCERVRLKLKECLDSGFVPSWLTRGRTLLLQKDKNNGNVASTYRPRICLPLMWKLLTGVVADQINAHLHHENFYQKSRKGAGKVLEELMIYFILIGQ